MLDTLADLPLAVRLVIAFVVVLILMVITFWVIRRFGGTRLGATSRGRQPRLAVIDAAAVDGRRRLVLVRRDNVEHLLLIGGPADVVVEQNIVRAVPVAPVPEAPVARPAAPEPLRGPDVTPPRTPSAPRPEAPARAEFRTRAVEAEAHPPPRDMRSETTRVEPRGRARESEPAEPVRAAERPVRPQRPAERPAAPPRAASAAARPSRGGEERQASAPPDVNLSEMAQRLEAALRRPAAAEARGAAAEARPAAAEARGAAAEARAAPSPPARPPRPEPSRSGPGSAETPRADKPAAEAAPTPAPAPVPPSQPEAQPQEAAKEAESKQSGKSVFDSLEEEMANLLGRKPGKTG